jgi:hypothetical protein
MESKLGPLGTSAIYWPIVPAPGDSVCVGPLKAETKFHTHTKLQTK